MKAARLYEWPFSGHQALELEGCVIKNIGILFFWRHCTWKKYVHTVNSFKCQPHKIIKHNQTIRRQQPRNFLNVFDHFVGLALKGLRCFLEKFTPFLRTLFFYRKPLETYLRTCEGSRWHVLVQSQQWKNHMWHLFNVNTKDTIAVPLTLFGVALVNFEQISQFVLVFPLLDLIK